VEDALGAEVVQKLSFLDVLMCRTLSVYGQLRTILSLAISQTVEAWDSSTQDSPRTEGLHGVVGAVLRHRTATSPAVQQHLICNFTPLSKAYLAI
jgi:hypothetical protein